MIEGELTRTSIFASVWDLARFGNLGAGQLTFLIAKTHIHEYERHPGDARAGVRASVAVRQILDLALGAGIVGLWDGKIIRCS